MPPTPFGRHRLTRLRPWQSSELDLTKRFAKWFAEALSQSEPSRFLATSTKSLRNKRIFVDYLRSGRGASGGIVFPARSARRTRGHAHRLERSG
jgi:DNA primase